MRKCFARIISLCMIMAALCLLPIYTHAAEQKMSLQWQKGKRTVEIGKKLRLKVKIRHKKKGSKLVWSSSSKKIATVSKQGIVSGKKAGKVKISVKIRGTAVKKSCRIQVVKSSKAQKSSDQKTPSPKKTPIPGSKPGNSERPPAVTNSNVPKETGLPGVNPSVSPANPTESPLTPTIEPTNPTESPLTPTTVPANPTESPLTPTTVPTTSPTPVYVPEDTELIPYSTVMEIQGEVMTVFLINKSYDDQVRVKFNGKEFTAAGNAKDALMLLAYGGTTKEDSAGRIRISRKTDEDGKLEEYWNVEDLEQGISYQMKVETKNSINPAIANCGVIYFRGDVTSAIEIY